MDQKKGSMKRKLGFMTGKHQARTRSDPLVPYKYQ